MRRWVVVRCMNAAEHRCVVHGRAAVAVAYLVLVSPNYWPWYATLPVALLVMLPGRTPLVLAVALSLGSRLVAPLDMLFEHQALSRFWLFAGTWLVGIAAPIALTALLTVLRQPSPAGSANALVRP